MRQVIYAMRFQGRGGLVEGSTTLRRATTSSPSTRITSAAGPEGLEGVIEPVPGGEVTCEAEVTLTGGPSFLESGTISFGGDNRLRFSTVGEGYRGPSADESVTHGTVMWKVDGGEGQFEGASGFITSNFIVRDSGEVVDHQFGVFWVR